MGPRFSIIIPTFNRSHLLRFALQSVMDQTFEDVEVLISDDNSTDNTQTIIDEVGLGKVRHLKTPCRMTMADHFEWASMQTSGEFVMFLCDDDVLSPHALSVVNDAIEETKSKVIALNSGVYTFPDWDVGENQNKLSYSVYSPNFAVCDSEKVLRGLFDLKPNFATPRGNNSFTHRAVIEAARTRNGRFFLHPAPDMSSCSTVLKLESHFTFIGLPLHVWGVSLDSIGAIQDVKGGADGEKSREAFGDHDFFKFSPFKTYCPSNIWAESMLQVKSFSPDSYPDLNFSALYVDCLRHLNALKDKGYDVEKETDELDAIRKKMHLTTLSNSIAAKVRASLIASPFSKSLLSFKRMILASDTPIKEIKKTTKDGGVAGFSNILESVKQFDGFFTSR